MNQSPNYMYWYISLANTVGNSNEDKCTHILSCLWVVGVYASCQHRKVLRSPHLSSHLMPTLARSDYYKHGNVCYFCLCIPNLISSHNCDQNTI